MWKIHSLEFLVCIYDILNTVYLFNPKQAQIDYYWMMPLFLDAFKQYSHTFESHFYSEYDLSTEVRMVNLNKNLLFLLDLRFIYHSPCEHRQNTSFVLFLCKMQWGKSGGKCNPKSSLIMLFEVWGNIWEKALDLGEKASKSYPSTK